MRSIRGYGVAITLLAATGLAAAQEPSVGVAASVVPDATGTPPRGQARTLSVGLDVVYNERIATGPIGRTQMLFRDGSALTVGPNSDLVLDEFVYDPATETGKLAITASKGVMRLVGGKISKTEPVTLKTPTATIGIRGGIAIYDNGQATLLFGKSMTVDAAQPDGSVARVELVRPGSVTIAPNGQIGPVTPVNAAVVATSLGSLEGSRGNSGGATEQPTENRVAATQVAVLGSTNVPATIAPVSAAPPPPPPTTASDTVARQVRPSDVRQVATNEGSDIGSRLQQRRLSGVVLIDPVFSGFNFATTAAPHVAANFDRGAFAFAFAGMFFGFSPNSNSFAALPFGQGQFDIDPASTSGSGGRFSGNGFVNDARDFFFYRLRLIDQGNKPAFFFGGVRNEDPVTQRTQTAFTAWKLVPGFPADNQIPLLPAAFGGNFGGATVSPLLAVLRPNTPETVVPGSISALLYSALAIEGQGASQRSAFIVRTGPFFVDSNPDNPTFGKLTIGGSSNGSTRLSATGSPIRIVNNATPIFDADGFSFYGQSGQLSFVLGSDQYTATSPTDYQDAASFAQPLNSLTTSNEFYQATAAVPSSNLLPSGIGTSRTTRTLGGYAAGVAEALTNVAAGTVTPYVFSTMLASPTGVSISTDAAFNELQGTFKIRDESLNFQGFGLEFGDINNPGNSSRSAFIDDRLFGARHSASRQGTVGANNATTFSMYMASYDVVPNTSYFASGSGPCDCQYTRWGFFGFDINGPGQPRTRGHINTWVAGDVPDIGSIPLSGTATYNGHAVGTVVNNGAIYVAGGSYSQSWNFATNSGSASITNFDGRSVTTSSLSAGNRRDFSGALIGAGLSGNLKGSFVQGGGDPVAEAMGQFSFSGTGYQAAGTVAARK